MIFLSRHRARLLSPLLFACLSLPSLAQAPAAPADTMSVAEKPKPSSTKPSKPPAATEAKQLPSVSVAVSQQPPGVSADAATPTAGSSSKPAAPPAKSAVPATTAAASTPAATSTAPAKTTTATPTPQPAPAPVGVAPTGASPTKPVAATTNSAPAPAKPPVITKPAVATSNAPALGTISESERRALATMPLPKLPTLVPRETPATSITAAVAEAALPPAPAPAPSIRPTVVAESPTSAEIRSLLGKASERTGLADAQLARIAQLQATAARGEQENALVGLLRLNDELDAAYDSYSVGNGESLWQIAAKPETYGNANLWPLIWRANPKALPQPSQVKSGQKLRVPRYPSLKAVTEALDYAGSHPVGKQ